MKFEFLNLHQSQLFINRVVNVLQVHQHGVGSEAILE